MKLIENYETELSTKLNAKCVLEAKINDQWKTLITQYCEQKYSQETIKYLKLVGDKQFTRYEKRRIRQVN